MKNVFNLCIVFTLFAAFINVTPQTQVYKVKVFEDVNKNNILDKGENGIEGISVSNQSIIVKTDKNGYCEIPKVDNDFIYVIKPANYSTPLNKFNIPVFYHSSYSDSHESIMAKGVNQNEIEFPLYKCEISTKYDMLMLGDPQSKDETEVGYMRDDFVKNFVNSNYKFAIFLGDISFDNKKIYKPTNEVLSKMNIPLYFVPGNHDMDYSAEDDSKSLESFRKIYGPEYYSFEYGDVHYIILDDINWQGLNSETKKRDYVGGISKKQLAWLENDIAFTDPNKIVVISMHIPINSIGGDYDANKLLNKDEFFRIIEKREKVFLTIGHTHTQEHNFYSKNDGWNGKSELRQYICSTICGAWWSGVKDFQGIPMAIEMDGTPRGYNVFSFDGTNYIQSFYVLNKKEDYQLRIGSPFGVIEKANIDSTEIVVNVFNGNKNSEVVANIDGTTDIILENVICGDPAIDRMIQADKSLYRSWMHAENTSHIWKAKLPNHLSVGIHTLKVTTKDEYNRKFKETVIFEIK